MLPAAPTPLTRGDTIAIIAPAGPVQDQEAFGAGLSLLQQMGYQPLFPRDLWPGTGYLADSDSKRTDELLRMWQDDEVKAVLAARGGYGCLRLLPNLDLTATRSRGKLLVGFSDLTILHNLLYAQTGRISLHGPVLTTLAQSSQEGLERFFACLAGRWSKAIEHPQGLEILRGGDPVSGPLLGGNLSSLVSLLGSPAAPDFSGSILFLEEVGESLYRIDRLLMQLLLTGVLAQVGAVILGDFLGNEAVDNIERFRFHEQIWTRVLELTAKRGIPVWGGFPLGHIPENLTLPHGAPAHLDSDAACLSFPV